jgi:hypothetical protein
MKITCPILKENNHLTSKYTCDGDNINPPLEISDIPEEAKSLVLVVDDPDAPGGTFTHWLVWNIHPVIKKIEENDIPLDAVEGVNSAGDAGYMAPCPPTGTHRYRFKLYALDKYLSLKKTATQEEVEKNANKNLIEKSELITKYQRS